MSMQLYVASRIHGALDVCSASSLLFCQYINECRFIAAFASMNLLLCASFSATVASRGAFEFNGRIAAGGCDGMSVDGASFGIESVESSSSDAANSERGAKLRWPLFETFLALLLSETCLSSRLFSEVSLRNIMSQKRSYHTRKETL